MLVISCSTLVICLLWAFSEIRSEIPFSILNRVINDRRASDPDRENIIDCMLSMIAGSGDAKGSNLSRLVKYYYKMQSDADKNNWAGTQGIPLGSKMAVVIKNKTTKMGVNKHGRKMYYSDQFGAANKPLSTYGTHYLEFDRTTSRADLIQLMLPNHKNCELNLSIEFIFIPPQFIFEGLEDICMDMCYVRDNLREKMAKQAGKDAASQVIELRDRAMIQKKENGEEFPDKGHIVNLSKAKFAAHILKIKARHYNEYIDKNDLKNIVVVITDSYGNEFELNEGKEDQDEINQDLDLKKRHRLEKNFTWNKVKKERIAMKDTISEFKPGGEGACKASTDFYQRAGGAGS